MDPRNKKIIKKRIKDLGKAKSLPIKNLREYMDELEEKRKHFPHNFLYWLIRCKRKIGEGFYYAKCRIFHPYNVIRIKTLPPTWIDKDCTLLHACFTIFCDVVENEDLFDHKMYDHSEQIAKTKAEDWENKEDQGKFIKQLEERHNIDQEYEKEARYLYEWWKVLRPERNKKLNVWTKYSLDAEEKGYKEDTDHLIRLMKIRCGLWT